MKRETVKELLGLSDEMLKDTNLDGLVKHREVAQHYASGGDVEILDGVYKLVNDPHFYSYIKYRKALPEIEVFGVKVRANPPETEPLEFNRKYYFLNMESRCLYSFQNWDGDYIDCALLKNKAIWKNESDIKAVVKALKGEQSE